MMPRAARPWFPGGERVASFALLLATLYAAYVTIRPVLLVVVLAAAVATLSYGFYKGLVRRLGGRRRLAALLLVLAVLLGVFGPLSTVGVVAVERLVRELRELAARLSSGGPHVFERWTTYLGPLREPAERFLADLQPRIAEAAPLLAQRLAQVVGAVGSLLARLLIGVFLASVALYYFYLNGRLWRERLAHLLPLPADDVEAFLNRFHQVSVGVIVGSLGTAAVQGLLAVIGYTALRVPVPLLWGVATALAALVPPLGSALVWVPLAIATAATRGWLWGLLLALYGAFAISMIDNVVRPLVTKNALQIHPLFVFIALFGGVASYGLAGVFLGPLAMALAITVLDLYESRATES